MGVRPARVLQGFERNHRQYEVLCYTRMTEPYYEFRREKVLHLKFVVGRKFMTENRITTKSGTARPIVEPRDPRESEKVQITLEGADEHYRELRLENTLTDENGNEVQLKEGAHVDVTVIAHANATTVKSE
jgi:hypothetical protein